MLSKWWQARRDEARVRQILAGIQEGRPMTSDEEAFFEIARVSANRSIEERITPMLMEVAPEKVSCFHALHHAQGVVEAALGGYQVSSSESTRHGLLRDAGQASYVMRILLVYLEHSPVWGSELCQVQMREAIRTVMRDIESMVIGRPHTRSATGFDRWLKAPSDAP